MTVGGIVEDFPKHNDRLDYIVENVPKNNDRIDYIVSLIDQFDEVAATDAFYNQEDDVSDIGTYSSSQASSQVSSKAPTQVSSQVSSKVPTQVSNQNQDFDSKNDSKRPVFDFSLKTDSNKPVFEDSTYTRNPIATQASSKNPVSAQN